MSGIKEANAGEKREDIDRQLHAVQRWTEVKIDGC